MGLLLSKSKSFEWQILLLFFVLGDKKLSSHIDQISEQINYSNQKIHSYNKIINMIVNLGSKKGKKNDNSSPQITCLYNSSLMSIVETLENNLSKVDSEI